MFTQSNYVRLLSGWGVVGLAVVSMLVVIGGFALHEALWRRVVGVSAPRVVQFPPVLAVLHQFRMQFPQMILSIYFSSHCCVTCVLELHATLWSQHARMAVFAVSCIWNLRVLDRKLCSG